MVATVIIEQLYNTAPGTFKEKNNSGFEASSSRYMTSDQEDGSLTTYPIPIPVLGNGCSGSYWITHLVNCTVSPDTYLSNLRYYQTWTVDSSTDWTLGVGRGSNVNEGMYIGISSASLALARLRTQGFPSGSYDQATGTEGVFGDRIDTGHAWYAALVAPMSGGIVPVEGFNNLSNAIMVHSGQWMTNPSTGRSRCIATQVFVGSGATPGMKADRTATFVYSEA